MLPLLDFHYSLGDVANRLSHSLDVLLLDFQILIVVILGDPHSLSAVAIRLSHCLDAVDIRHTNIDCC